MPWKAGCSPTVQRSVGYAVLRERRLGVSSGVAIQACLPSFDVRALPTCRGLYNNSLSGTLPKGWSTMTSLKNLYVHDCGAHVPGVGTSGARTGGQ
jgi:hypothetical protein